MSERTSLTKSMRRATADHEILALYIKCYNKMFSHPSPRVTGEATAATRVFLHRKIVDHFAYEERRIFPFLLEAMPIDGVAELVAGLREDHKLLLREARRLNRLLSREELAYDRPSMLRKAMIDFFHHVEKHASRENELFPSLL